MTTMSAQARVAAGIALLDARRPGWEQQIDLGRLNIGSPKLCVLGQLYGLYSDGVCRVYGHRLQRWSRPYAWAKAAFEWAIEHGFVCDVRSEMGVWLDLPALNAAWGEAVAARTQVAPVVGGWELVEA